MPCRHINTPWGPAIIRTHGRGMKVCHHCSSPSSLLCDYPTRGGGTCSAAICEACALRTGKDLDYCRKHAPFVFLTPSGGRIIVGNIRDLGPLAGVLVDRTTPLGNPFRLKSVDKREDCVNQYRKWLWGRLCKEPDGPEAQELRRLVALASASDHDLILLCWCAPLICHGQLIARVILWMQSREPDNASAKLNQINLSSENVVSPPQDEPRSLRIQR